MRSRPKCSRLAAQEWGSAKENEAIAEVQARLGDKAVLLQKGFRVRCGEIDQIWICDFELIFVEVRARSRTTALESVDSKKRNRIERAARWFLAGYRGGATSVSFGVLVWEPGGWQWYPCAWG